MPTLTDPITDQEALARYARDRDPDAFDYLVRQYQSMVYAACRRNLSDPGDVDDAVQETFIKLARKAGSIRTNLPGWLYSAAVSTARDMTRRFKTRRRHEADAVELAQQTRGEPSAWDALGPSVDAALQKLRPVDREVLVERYFVGRTVTELAARYGISVSAAHQRKQRAVERLRAQLKKSGVVVPAAGLATVLASAGAEAAAPAHVTVSLTKIGLAGAPTQTGLQALLAKAATTSLQAKLAASGAGVVLLTAAVGTGAALLQSPSPPAPVVNQTSNNTLSDPDLDGSWRQTGFRMDDSDPPTMRFDGQQISFEMMTPGRGPNRVIWDIVDGDPGASPARLTAVATSLVGEEARSGNEQILGLPASVVYRVQDDVLELGFYNPLQEAEPRYDFEPEDGKWLMKWYRTREAVPAANDQRHVSSDLIGAWSMIDVHQMTEFENGLVTVTDRRGEMLYQYEVLSWDDNVVPRRMTCVCIDSQENTELGLVLNVIYEIEDGQLRMACVPSEQDPNQWPGSFQSTPGDGLELSQWTREAR